MAKRAKGSAVVRDRRRNRTGRFSIHRLAHYCIDLAELLDTERVVPVVIFLRSGSRPECLRLGGDRHTYLDFRYIACDLYALPALDYQDSDNLVVRLALPTMQYGSDQRLDIYAAAQLGLIQLETDPNKRSKYVDFIDYYADLSDEEQARYRATYAMPSRWERCSRNAETQGTPFHACGNTRLPIRTIADQNLRRTHARRRPSQDGVCARRP